MAETRMDKGKQQKEKRIRRVRLTNATDVKRYCGWIARRIEANVIEPEIAKAINSLLRTLLKAVEMDQLADLESRLVSLEKQIEDRK